MDEAKSPRALGSLVQVLELKGLLVQVLELKGSLALGPHLGLGSPLYSPLDRPWIAPLLALEHPFVMGLSSRPGVNWVVAPLGAPNSPWFPCLY